MTVIYIINGILALVLIWHGILSPETKLAIRCNLFHRRYWYEGQCERCGRKL